MATPVFKQKRLWYLFLKSDIYIMGLNVDSYEDINDVFLRKLYIWIIPSKWEWHKSTHSSSEKW